MKKEYNIIHPEKPNFMAQRIAEMLPFRKPRFWLYSCEIYNRLGDNNTFRFTVDADTEEQSFELARDYIRGAYIRDGFYKKKVEFIPSTLTLLVRPGKKPERVEEIITSYGILSRLAYD